MYDLQWRLRNPIQKDLDDNTKKEYRSQVVYLLQSIDDSIINEQKNMNSEDKVYALCTKYNRDIQEDLVFREGQLFFEDNMMYRIRNYSLFTIHIIDIIDNHLHMEGRINSFIHLHDCRYFIRSGKDFEKELTFFELPGDLRYGMDGVIGKRMGFIVDIPLKNTQKIRFTLNYKNDNEIRLLVAYGRFTKLDRNLKHSYCIIKNYLLTSQRGILTVKCYRRKAHLIKELRKLWRLLVIKKWEVFFFRLLYYLNKRRYRNKEIWFVSDQQKTVGDNGEFMFRYIMKHKPEGIHAFFILSKDSKDIEKMEEVGPVVIEFSFQHKFYSLFASKIISSHANETSLNPFLQNRIFIKDLYHFDFVFLQHGIIMNDLSGWLNKFNKNIKLFITSAKQEYLSIVKNYMYDEKIVKLTGLPRYDGLMVDEKPKKQILLSPTWRRKLAQWDGGSGDDGERRYNPYFKDSEYYKFYNTLINDKRLLDALKEYGYRMKFCNHHAMKQQNQDFL
jgi:hypothetical protein